MKKGINVWSFPESFSLENCFKLAKEAGIDGVELAIMENGKLPYTASSQEINKIKDMARKEGIELPTAIIVLSNWLSGSKEEREKAKRQIVSGLEVGRKLGVDTLLLVPGGVDLSIWSPGRDIVPYDVAYKRIQEGLKSIAQEARDRGVYLGIENVWNKFLLSPLEFKNFIDEIGEEYIKAYFDTGNVLVSGYPEQWIRILGKRIRKVHLKDFKSSVGNINGFCNLLEGDVHWHEVIKAFKEIGYDDYLTAEMIPPYRYYPERLIYDTSMAMDKIING